MNWLGWLKWYSGIVLAAVVATGAYFAIASATGVHPLEHAVGRGTLLVHALVLIAWSIWGMHLVVDGERSRWVKFVQGVLTSKVLAASIAALALVMWPDQFDAIRRIALVVWGSWWVFIGMLELARFALSFNWQPLAVARTVLDEGVHLKAISTLVGLALLALAVLPFMLSPDEPLKYQVQTFLSWSIAIVTVMLSVMTIVLACWTLSNEITEKQIFTIAVKPVSRGAYLLGKWIGLVTLNGVMLAVTGLAIYGFVTFFLASEDALRNRSMNREDRVAVVNEVLTARLSSQAEPPRPLDIDVQEQLEKMIKERPHDVLRMGKDEALDRGITWAGDEMIMQLGAERAAQILTRDAWEEWTTIGPNEVETYVFTGLGPAYRSWERRYNQWYPRAEQQLQELTGKRYDLSDHVKMGETMRDLARTEPRVYGQIPPPPVNMMALRYKLRAPGQEKVVMRMRFNDRQLERELLANEVQVIKVPVNFVDEQGRMVLEVALAMDQYRRVGLKPPTVTFSTSDGLAILYAVDNFTSNFVRAFLALWIKLGFLAMIGLWAATFLSFPVAAMLGFTAWVVALLTPYLSDSLRAFGLGESAVGEGVAWGIRWIAQIVMWTMTKFAEFSPRQQIVEGLLFSWTELGWCLLWVGMLQTSIIALIAWLIYRRKELARVQV